MFSRVYKIKAPWPRQLATAARPRGEDWLGDELAAWRNGGIAVVVSLLEIAEAAALGLGSEAEECANVGLRFLSYPIPDRGVPADLAAFRSFVELLVELLDGGETVVVHCRHGIGRASLVAAAVLASGGVAPDEAWTRIADARGRPVPDTQLQRTWLEGFVDSVG